MAALRKLHREYLALIAILAVVPWGLLFFGHRNIEASKEGMTAEPTAGVTHGPAASDVATFFTVNANRPKKLRLGSQSHFDCRSIRSVEIFV